MYISMTLKYEYKMLNITFQTATIDKIVRIAYNNT